ncbi:MAG: FixH family protein [Methyloligellaceae bacterium]
MVTEKANREFTGWHMLIIMLLFFGVIITVNITMAIFAASSWTGLVVKNSYVASQNFNEHLNNAEKQARLGWSSNLTTKNGKINLTLHDSLGKPLTGLQVTALIQRPAHEREDITLNLKQNSSGQYYHEKILTDGAWNIKITAKHPDQDNYIQIFKIEVRKERL